MKKVFNVTKWLLLISGIIITVLGITMLFTPLENLITLAVFIGISMLISGISEIVAYFYVEKGNRSWWILASGILSTLFAIWTIFGSGSSALISILPFVFAVWVMSSGVVRVVGSISLKTEGIQQWLCILIFGVIGTMSGFILLFSPILSAIIVAYSIALILISHGINNIIIFFRLKNLGTKIRNHINDRY